jgi:hypothetical protein
MRSNLGWTQSYFQRINYFITDYAFTAELPRLTDNNANSIGKVLLEPHNNPDAKFNFEIAKKSISQVPLFSEGLMYARRETFLKQYLISKRHWSCG